MPKLIGGLDWRVLAGISALVFCVVAYSCAEVAANPRAQQTSTPAADAAPAAGQTEAKATFDSVCAACHGIDGRGGERGPDIASRGEVAQKSNAQLTEILEKGKVSTGMPAFAGYGAPRLSGLVAYLRVLQGKGKAAPPPGDAAAGKTIYFGKGKCSDCHMVAGKGGFYASDLSNYAGGRNAEKIRAAIVSPDKGLDPRRGLVTVVRNDASSISGRPRNQDNFSLQLQTPDGAFHIFNKSELRSVTYEGRTGMPVDYGTALSKRELDDLISFLMRAQTAKSGSESESDWRDGDDEDE